MQEVIDFLRKCETYYLATLEGDQPRVRPFGTVNLFEGKLYILTGKAKSVSKQMTANPKIELSGTNGGEWIRIRALAAADDRVEPKQSMLDQYPSLQQMYSATDDNTQVFYLKDAVATIASFTGASKEIKL